MTPKGDHLRILHVLRRAMARREVRSLCEKHGIGSTTIYQATKTDSGNPSLAVFCKIINALGYEVSVRPKRWNVCPPKGYPKPLPPDAKAQLDRAVAAAERRP